MSDPYDRRRPQQRDWQPPPQRAPYQPTRSQPPRRQPPRRPPPRKGFSPGRVLFFGFLGLALGEAVKWWQDSFSPLFVSLSTIGVAMIPLLIDYARSSQEPTAGPDHAPYPGRYRPRPHRRGGALLVGILVLVTVGGGAAYGISWGIGRLTGNETVIADRLVEPVTGTADTLSVTVTAVQATDHFTKVAVTAKNDDSMTVSIKVWSSSQLVDGTGQALKPLDNFGGASDIDVPANGIMVTGVITFDGRLAPDATTATLTFSFLFSMDLGFDADSLQVENIQLEPFTGG
jgi:hypothetical protein